MILPVNTIAASNLDRVSFRGHMQIRAIALPKGAGLLWIRVGKYLDPIFGHQADETVESINSDKSGFSIKTVCPKDGRGWMYLVDHLFVSRLETVNGDVVSPRIH